jgi:hypothetical protein
MKRPRHRIDIATVSAAAVVEAAAASILCAVGPHAYAQTPTAPAVVAAAPLNPNSDCTLDPSQPTRRRPGHTPRDRDEVECDPNRLPTPDTTALPVPAAQDRWRVVDQVGAPATVVNPYAANNLLKGDRPLWDRPIFGGN